jgi:nucleoside-diphosphate-sugar epimerase
MAAYIEREAQAVIAVFKGIARRVVALSSIDVYRAFGRLQGIEPGPPDPVPLREDAPLRETLYPDRRVVDGIHDHDKILVERVVMGDADLPGTVLRLPMVYGPSDHMHRLLYYVKRMDDRRPAILLDEDIARHRATHGFVENVAAAIVLATTTEGAAGRIYNVGEELAVSEADWVRAIGRAAGWTGEVVVLSRERLPVALRWWGDADTNQDWVSDTTRIRTELGFRDLVPQDEVLSRTVAWERANPSKDYPSDMFDYTAEDAVLAAVAR